MVRILLENRWNVDLSASIELPFSAGLAWEQLQDWQRFGCMDIFHQAIYLQGPQKVGAPLRIPHRFACFNVMRVGRLLIWHENHKYAFSDLSSRGPCRGFPHVYVYELNPEGDGRCCLKITVKGKWTATWIPRVLVRLWLGWIMLKLKQSVNNELLASELSRRRRQKKVQ